MSGQNIAWRINRIQRKERSLEKLALEFAKDKPDSMQIWVGQTGFSLRVIRRKNWGKKGKRKKITEQRGTS